MKSQSKNIIKVNILFILIIPVFFGVLINYLVIINLDLLMGVVTLILMGGLYLIGRLTNKALYKEDILDRITNHEVVYTFVNRKNWINIWGFFPITLAMEEFIFRFYFIGLLLVLPNMNVWVPIISSSLAFSLYHLHIWFAYKNAKILLNYLVYTLLMGLILGVFFIWYGLIICILVHILIALSLYYDIAAKKRANL